MSYAFFIDDVLCNVDWELEGDELIVTSDRILTPEQMDIVLDKINRPLGWYKWLGEWHVTCNKSIYIGSCIDKRDLDYD